MFDKEIPVQQKVLALHGMGSNKLVTELQLQNLGIVNENYSITYINGVISVDTPEVSLSELTNIINEEWYSWLPPKAQWHEVNSEILLKNICEAIIKVLVVIEKYGPFDIGYGFSQGGYIIDLINNLPNDPILLEAVKSHLGRELSFDISTQLPFKNLIYACVGSTLSISELRRLAGLSKRKDDFKTQSIIYLIGKHDVQKSYSENFVLENSSIISQVIYLDGGHEINSNVPDHIKKSIKESLENKVPKNSSNSMLRPSCTFSSLEVFDEYQATQVYISTKDQPHTIVDLLFKRTSTAPLFRHARNNDQSLCTTYGQMLAFLSPKGEGDLRRIGVKDNEIIAYVAPPGGSAESAVTFLTIAAQACAVPLSVTMTENETLEALKQLQVDHIVIFENVNAKSVITACEKYCAELSKQLHYVQILGNEAPGLFRFKNSLKDFESLPPLLSSAENDCLLLRTSGTTSTPKIVPLKQKDLVLNSTILANSIGINEFDITYSVMPLDHIGGISASILASLSVGAAITCDGLYNPQLMVEALKESSPQPTWYSSVPTIHVATLQYLKQNNEKYLNEDGIWTEHNLRLIRSGAAALREEDRIALMRTYDCPVLPTYSMSELMPISQPIQTEMSWDIQEGSVGVPLIASLIIVNSETLLPQPYGVTGEIAISGDTVFSGYKDNLEANQNSRFLMKLPNAIKEQVWFLTGDLGQIDNLGNLTLKGRSKELIKRGGEQISPSEIEDKLIGYAGIDLAICFPVPSEIYGEEVGCVIVSSDPKFDKENLKTWAGQLRKFLIEQGVAIHKIPSIWTTANKTDLPMTNSKKYKRNSMAQALQITTTQSPANSSLNTNKEILTKNISPDKPKVDWDSIAGFRFILACYVMFMHFGSNNSWDAFNNLRQFQWHVNSFFILAGFSLAILMPSLIQKKFAFVKSKIAVMYPLYVLAIIFAMANLFVSCEPSTFISNFSWASLHSTAPYCQGTPLIESSWTGNVISSLIIYLTGLQATPLWGASWFIGFYLWFISMYFQCLVVFPLAYNALYKNRGNINKILLYIGVGLIINMIILWGFWYGYAIDFVGYGPFDTITGIKTTPSASQILEAGKDNAVGLGFYLFAPFWMIYFLLGIGAAFLYDAIRPTEQKRSQIWGYIADSITIIILCVAAAHVSQGYFHLTPEITKVPVDFYFMRPEEANSYADPGITNRIWDEIYSRSFAALTLLWIFAISTGKGLTARILRARPLSQFLAPTAYACFLFHQMVGQWYYAITRHGHWWNWWEHRKSFYWFSPEPVPVEWYEYFYLVGLVVLFAKLVQPFDSLLHNIYSKLLGIARKQKLKEQPALDIANIVLKTATNIAGLEVSRDLGLNDNGLASLGTVRFISALETEFSSFNYNLSLSVSEVIAAQDLNEIIELIQRKLNEEEESELIEIAYKQNTI
ncbi:AMP-dependent synthetase [Acinetobacter pittii]|uniref:AMP-binding protein n=1 Tax=Acinetobacter pittii TaxID=48296 RepID=UPI001022D90C|nr:AMP-binding protein [Acinetobacter pittii]RZG99888.1 AMP-dependent synthetase [Acinetobacter pittii]